MLSALSARHLTRTEGHGSLLGIRLQYKFLIYRTKYSLCSVLVHHLVTHLNLGIGMSFFLSHWHQFILLYGIKVRSHSLRKSLPSSIVRGKECLIIGKERSKSWEFVETTSYQLCARAKGQSVTLLASMGIWKNAFDLLQIPIFVILTWVYSVSW